MCCFLFFCFLFSFFLLSFFFFFNDTATTEIYTLSLQRRSSDLRPLRRARSRPVPACSRQQCCRRRRSEEHTSELQSRSELVCRLLLETKKKVRPASRHARGAQGSTEEGRVARSG